jgi:AhpD family alkylhydroperoxidase
MFARRVGARLGGRVITHERRTYRFIEFVEESIAFLVRLPHLLRARRRRRVSEGFESKLMLTVTAVNGCRYCGWFHSRLAEHRDVSRDEIRALLSGVVEGSVEDHEIAGVLFAQHFAETNRRPTPEAVARLCEAYDGETVADILVFLRMVTVGNLSGNTYRSFVERLRGRGAGRAGLLDDLLVFIATAPVFGPIGLLMPRGER